MIPKGTKPGRVKPKNRETAIRKAARGQNCTLRLPCCNGNPETTVLAHIRNSAFCGVGMKPHDIMGLFACSSCHDALDGRSNIECTDYDVLRAHLETLDILLREGIIFVK